MDIQRVKVITRTTIKMASGVQDITCVFVEVAGSYEKKKKTLILQCPGMVCSPPVVSKCLGEAHRRLELFTLHYISLNHCFFSFFHTVGNFGVCTEYAIYCIYAICNIYNILHGNMDFFGTLA